MQSMPAHRWAAAGLRLLAAARCRCVAVALQCGRRGGWRLAGKPRSIDGHQEAGAQSAYGSETEKHGLERFP